MKPLVLAALVLLPSGMLQAQVKKVAVSARPVLYARLAKGPKYSQSDLTKNLNWTEKNISNLLDYIYPPDKNDAGPEGAALEDASKSLASESAAAEKLIAEGDAALAKVIVRDDSAARDRLTIRIARGMSIYTNPTPAQRLRSTAIAQATVLGALADLLDLKRRNPPDAEAEADAERWLDIGRKSLARAVK